MGFFAISALVNAFTSLVLGFLVYFKNRKNATNNAFILLSSAVFVWSVFYFLWQISTEYNAALLYTRLLSIGSSFIPLFYLYWVLSFLETKDKKDYLVLALGSALTFVYLIFSFSPIFVQSVEKMLIFEFWPKAGWLYTVYIFTYIFLVCYGLKKLCQTYSSSSGLKHHQVKYVIFGSIIGFLGGATNFFLWYNIPILPFGNIVVSVYVFILFYAMIRYRLMDIRIVARKFFVYFGISAFTYAFFYFLIWFYNSSFGGLFTSGAYLVGIIVAPLFVFCFYRIESAIKTFANRYLFVSLYNYQETINRLIDELTNYIDLDKIINLIAEAIKKSMSPETISVYLANNNAGSIEYQKLQTENQNKELDKKDIISENNFLIKHLSQCHKPLVKEELLYFSEEAVSEKEKNKFIRLYKQMEQFQASLCLPLVANKKLIGVIVLGIKISEDPYTGEDINLLDLVSKQAGIAIENARQYQQIQEFGKTLQEKIDEQTKDIVAQKEEVERISRLKSEFISIVSHQLRTPMSAIRGYTSMLQEGDYGKLPRKADAAVNYIYEAGVSMIKLINSLLSISRLEKGQVELKIEKVSIEKIVEDCIKDFEFLVKEKGLAIIYNKPKTVLPTIKGDGEKLKQSISNIINNAILYTPQGSITISLKPKVNNIIVQIKDTGVGIEKEEISKMFKSFSRGKGGQELYAQGTGLGLYVAKNFIEMHNGKICVKSEGKNKGSCFAITLPIKTNIETEQNFASKNENKA